MRKLLLNRGIFAIVDDEDFYWLSQWKWYANFCIRTKSFYVVCPVKDENGKWGSIRMHRILKGSPKGMVIDHINHDTLDNRKINLRICTQSQNQKNQKISKSNTSGYKGVSWNKGEQKWVAMISADNKRHFLGYHTTKEIAYEAYLVASKKYHKDFGCGGTTL